MKPLYLLSTAYILLNQRMQETSLHTFQLQAERKQTFALDELNGNSIFTQWHWWLKMFAA